MEQWLEPRLVAGGLSVGDPDVQLAEPVTDLHGAQPPPMDPNLIAQ